MQRDFLSRPCWVGAFPGRRPSIFHGWEERRRFALVAGPFPSIDAAREWIADHARSANPAARPVPPQAGQGDLFAPTGAKVEPADR